MMNLTELEAGEFVGVVFTRAEECLDVEIVELGEVGLEVG